MRVREAQWAAQVPWSGVQGRPDVPGGGPINIDDVTGLRAILNELLAQGGGGSPSGPAGGDLAGSYPNPSLKAVTTAATKGTSTAVPVVTVDAKGRVTGLVDVPIAFPSPARVINVMDYGAMGDGTADDYEAILDAIIDCEPQGGISMVVMDDFGTGYTSAPTVSFSDGTGSGVVAEAVVADMGATGEIAGVSITNRGSGYRVYARQCGVTSGDDDITCADTTGIVAGMAADNYLFPPGTTVVSVVSNTSIKLSANATGTNPYAQCAFGIPRVTFSGGGGSGAAGRVVVGDGVILYFPPGTYRISGSLDLTAKHNIAVVGDGAIILCDSGGVSGFVIDEWSWFVDLIGFSTDHKGTAWSPRDGGCGIRNGGNMVRMSRLTIRNAAEFGIANGGNIYGGSPFYSRGTKITDCTVFQSKGDGIHVTNGMREVEISACLIHQPGDDALGIVADGGTTLPPTEVLVDGVQIKAGGFRGIAILGASKVTVNAALIEDMEGYGIEVAAWNSQDVDDIAINNPQLLNIGDGGIGGVVAPRTGIVITDCLNGKLVAPYINTCTDWGIVISDVGNFDVMLPTILNAASGNMSILGSNTALTILYLVAGALTYRGASGTVTTVAPA